MTERQAFAPITLTASGLSSQRGGRLLFDGLDFAVTSGQALTLRGANGAGKTTLLLTLSGVIAAASGRIIIDGVGVDGPPHLHFCGHQNGIKARMSCFENVAFWAELNGSSGLTVAEALERVGLGAIAAVDAGYLSAGQAKRLALARLLVSARPVWLLDEPMAALDAAGDALVGRLIDDHLDASGLVIAATHDDLPLRDSTRVRVLSLGGRV